MIIKPKKYDKGPRLRTKGFDVSMEGKHLPIDELGNGHIQCPCGSSKFNVLKFGRVVSIGCVACAWDAWFEIPLSVDRVSVKL